MVSILLAASIAATPAPELAGPAFVAGPVLQAPTTSSITIHWITAVPSTGLVEYGSGETLSETAASAEDGLRESGRLHRVTLSGLRPDTTYRYRVASTEIRRFEPYKVELGATSTSDVRSFRTLSADRRRSVSFLLVNDNHERAELLRKRLTQTAPYDFAFFNGDMLDHVDSEEQVIERVLQPAADVLTGVGFVWVRGNHETRGVFARRLRDYAAAPGGAFYFAFDHGPVHILVLDGGEDKPDDHREYGGLVDFDAYRRTQAEWLAREVKSPAFRKARFRVAVMHIPPFADDDGLARVPHQRHGASEMARLWGPLLDRGVDLLLAGHTHRQQVVEPKQGLHRYPIFVGGAPQEGRGTVIRVEADASRLEVTMTGDDGGVLAKRSLRAH